MSCDLLQKSHEELMKLIMRYIFEGIDLYKLINVTGFGRDYAFLLFKR